MKTVLHKEEDRGKADYGWLRTNYSFSFSGWYNPEKIHFGLLRVMNDDTIDPGQGFGTHPHDNMEIVTIPLEGVVEHKDSTGSVGQIRPGEIQVMSAGKGIQHSEYNGSDEEALKLLQIWVFPKERNIEPRHDQRRYNFLAEPDRLHTIISPDPDDAMWINQDSWFSLGKFTESTDIVYDIRKKGNGVYLFVIEGTATVTGHELRRRDALGIWDTDKIEVYVGPDSYLLFIEVPMR